MTTRQTRKVQLFVLLCTTALLLCVGLYTKSAYADNLTPASATLSNPRLSFKAATMGSHPVGTSTISLHTSSQADIDTSRLYPNDSVCFIPSGQTTCLDSTLYEIDSIVDTAASNQFVLKNPLTSALSDLDLVVRNERTSLALSFSTTKDIPTTGDILVEIPAQDTGQGCDGIADSEDSVAENGFDLGPAEARVSAEDVVVTGCGNNDWNPTETITCGVTGKNHTIRIDRRNSICPAGSNITVIIDKNPGLIVPAPLTTHTTGSADVYSVDATTRDGDDNRLDTVDMQIAPVESVFVVAAEVPETLTFTVSGVSKDVTACGEGATRRVSTTSKEIPFGVYTQVNELREGQQRLTASTNAPHGYSVTLHEDDQMGREGKSCPGSSAGETDLCINDTACDDGNCTEKPGSESDWTNPSSNGLGFSLANLRGTDATFLYNGTSGYCTSPPHPFCARQIPDLEAQEDPTTVMTNSGPTDGAEAYACFRLSVSRTQPAGFYFNHITYTAIPNF